MNKIFKSAAVAIVALSPVLFASCGSGLTGVPAEKDVHKQEGLKSIKEKMVNAFGGDKKVHSLSITTKDHMDNTFGMASIGYLDNGKDMQQSFVTEPEEKAQPAKPSVVQSEFLLKSKQGGVAVKDFNLEQIAAKTEEAMKMIPAEYEGFYLHDWTYDVSNDNKITADFVIEGSKKGESSKQQGRMIVSNYYEFKFKMDEAGKVSMVE